MDFSESINIVDDTISMAEGKHSSSFQTSRIEELIHKYDNLF